MIIVEHQHPDFEKDLTFTEYPNGRYVNIDGEWISISTEEGHWIASWSARKVTRVWYEDKK